MDEQQQQRLKRWTCLAPHKTKPREACGHENFEGHALCGECNAVRIQHDPQAFVAEIDRLYRDPAIEAATIPATMLSGLRALLRRQRERDVGDLADIREALGRLVEATDLRRDDEYEERP
jgi:hypothetical protein